MSPSQPDTNDASAGRPHTQRQSSTSSQLSHASQSLSEASSSHSQHHRQHHHHKPHRHVVGGGGHGRMGARNTSFGKNLNKLTIKMPHDAPAGTAAAQAEMNSAGTTPNTLTPRTLRPMHGRSKSGGESSTGASEAASPRPSHAVKRNASAFVVPRNQSHSALKKNYSSGHLPRNHSGKGLNKMATGGGPRGLAPTAKRKHSTRSEKSAPASPASPGPIMPHPTVRFALADEEEAGTDDEENEWTEESASVSPNATRDNTRSNSVVLDPKSVGPSRDSEHGGHHDVTSGEESTNTVIHAPVSNGKEREQRSKQEDVDGEASPRHLSVITSNGERSHPSAARQGPLDADAITSRLLQRRAPSAQGLEPQITSISAIVQADSHDHKSLSQSQTSTLAYGTPGRDLVSRFVNANSNDGTPRDGNLLPHQKGSISPEKDIGGELDASKRNKSAPNMAVDKGPMSSFSSARSRRDGASTPNELPPSRTQQKLLLQRASSVIEPQKHIPAVLPRPGASQLLNHGLGFASNEGGAQASQIHALFVQINKEYNVVRRYRNPIADAAMRSREIPRPVRRQQQMRSRRVDENGVPLEGHESPVGSFKSRDESQEWHNSTHHSNTNNAQRRPPQSSRSEINLGKTRNHPQAQRKDDRGHKTRVSFDLPTSVRADEFDDDDTEVATVRTGGSHAPRGSMGERGEAFEICRRMWEMEPAEVAG